MTEKIKEHEDIPIYVYLHEDVIPEKVILLMVFYNGMTDAFDALISYLNDATETYLSGTVFTVIEDDPLDEELPDLELEGKSVAEVFDDSKFENNGVDVSDCCHSEDVETVQPPLRSSVQSSPDDPYYVCGSCEQKCEIETTKRSELED